MSEYRNPLKINADDPLCSSSTLGNTIIGILFDKKGGEIKAAIQERIGSVDRKIEEYKKVIAETEKFIEEKKAVLKNLDVYNQDRSDKRGALTAPIQEKIDDAHKQYMRKHGELLKQKDKLTSDFDKDTQKEVKQKAMDFESSFDSFKDRFKELDEFIIKERCVAVLDSKKVGISSDSISNTAFTTYTTNGNVGIGVNTPNASLYIHSSEKGDEAVARLNTLRSLLTTYIEKVSLVKEKIEDLNQERRRLALIHRNIQEEREYKLDLNKLSAFGFEDIEVK